MDIVIYFGPAVHFFDGDVGPDTGDIPSGTSGRFCERPRRVDYSSYEFTVDLGET